MIARTLRAVLLALVTGLGAAAALAQSGPNSADQDKALASAKAFLALVKDGKFNTAWNTHISQFFKQRTNQDVFAANMSMGRQNVGTLQSSRLVDVTYSAKDVGSGYVGDIYSVRFLNKYERGTFYDFLVLIKEADGQWRISGLGGSPAPND
jgi:hypothetical protein